MTMLREATQYTEDVAEFAPAVRKAQRGKAKVKAKVAVKKMVTKTAETELRGKNDYQLIELVRQGDKHAYDVLVCRHQQMVTSILLRMMDLPDAQDVAQETFMKAFRSLASFRGDSQFATWLYRIATNTAMNHLKTRKRRPPTMHLDALDNDKAMHGASIVDANTPESFVIAEELQRVLQRRLIKLKPDLREAITSYELDGMSYQEIADQMKCPVGTIRSRIYRSREIIDGDLRAHGFEPLSQGNPYGAAA